VESGKFSSASLTAGVGVVKCKTKRHLDYLKDLPDFRNGHLLTVVIRALKLAQMKILAFCGSLRTGSFNKKLLLHASDVLKGKGCEVDYIDLRDLEIPLYDGDLEAKSGIPTGVAKLADAIKNADGLVIGCPEYNGGITGVLKNTIDWVSRAKNPWVSKPILLVSTSPGWFGAIKSNGVTRGILIHLKAIVVPAQITIPHADKSLDEKGKLIDPLHQTNLNAGCDELIFAAKSFKK
jgi:chromate reductase